MVMAISPISATNKPQTCPGIIAKWEAGSIWDTYPYHQHGMRKLDWEPIGFDGNNQWIRLRSTYCALELPEGNVLCCQRCGAIQTSANFLKFQSQAAFAPDHTPHAFLNQRQLQAVLSKVVTKYKELSLKVIESALLGEIVLISFRF